MCVYLYRQNKYTQYTYIDYVNKNFYFGCDYSVSRLTALQKIINYSLHKIIESFKIFFNIEIKSYRTLLWYFHGVFLLFGILTAPFLIQFNSTKKIGQDI